MSEPFVLINAFEVPPEANDEFLRGWEADAGLPGDIGETAMSCGGRRLSPPPSARRPSR
jgi:hypothetical protein